MEKELPRWEPAARCEWPGCDSPVALRTGRWCRFHWDAGRQAECRVNGIEDAAKRPRNYPGMWAQIARNMDIST